jgi:putative transposase
MRIVIRVSHKVQVSAGGMCSVGYHVGWCPKYRRPILARRVASFCGELIRAKVDEHDWPMVAVGLMPDHGHLLVNAHPGGSLSRAANQFMRPELSHVRSRLPTLWFQSCFVATVDAMSGQIVRRHTRTQNKWR